MADFLDFAEGWAEGMADRVLEQLHRQADPVLRRRLLAEEFKKLATQIARETADQMIGEEM